MNIWYDQTVTLQSLRELNALDAVIKFILDNIQAMTRDFEIKRLLIGLSSLLMTPGKIDEAVQQQSGPFMRAIAYLCQKSFEIRLKEQKASDEKGEKAEVDKNAEKPGFGMLFDGDENYDEGLEALADGDDDDESEFEESDDDCDLYDTLFDEVDEVLLVHERLTTLQGQCEDQWKYLLGQLTDGERDSFHGVLTNNAQLAA